MSHPPYSTETALPALGTTNCAAVDAAVLDILKKHERNRCSWHCSCNTNLKTLSLGNDKALTDLQTSIFAGRTGTSCVPVICQLMVSPVWDGSRIHIASNRGGWWAGIQFGRP